MKNFQQQLLGKYVLLDKLTEGNMAEIYRAIIPGIQEFNELIAIKKILPNLADDEDLAENFINAAKLAALLHHQNIVQIYDFGCIDESCFIAMEFLSGKDYHQIFLKSGEKKNPLELSFALFILSRICGGLDYAHKLKDFQGKSLQIVHKNINPRNIFITYDGEVKILDFGIAITPNQAIIPKNKTDGSGSKMAYMSPEQVSDEAIDLRSDIFACGILLYEMVTGKRMFVGDPKQIFALVKEAKFIRPEEIRNDLPEKVINILYRSLAKNPNDRYQNCSNMLADIEECLQQFNEHPTAADLSKYMKTLFAEEIVFEQEHVGELINGIEDNAKTNGSSHLAMETKMTTEGKPSLDYLKDTIKKEPHDNQYSISSKKTVYTGIAVAITVIIALVTTFVGSKNEAYHPPLIKNFENSMIVDQERTVAFQESKNISPTISEREIYREAMGALAAEHYAESIKKFEVLQQLGDNMHEESAKPYAQALIAYAKKLAKNDAQNTLNLLTKAVKIDPVNEEGHFQLAMLFLRQKDFAHAITNFEKVIELNPKSADTFFNLGFIYAVEKNYIKSEEMYKRVIKFSPDYLDEALFNLAVIQNKQGKNVDAVANLEQAIALNHDNAPAQKYLRKIRNNSGEQK